jgi:hypothetical protein
VRPVDNKPNINISTPSTWRPTKLLADANCLDHSIQPGGCSQSSNTRSVHMASQRAHSEDATKFLAALPRLFQTGQETEQTEQTEQSKVEPVVHPRIEIKRDEMENMESNTPPYLGGPYRQYQTPATALHHWLNLNTIDAKREYFSAVEPDLDRDSSHTQVLLTLHRLIELHSSRLMSCSSPSSVLKLATDSKIDTLLDNEATLGAEEKEFILYAWILLAPGADAKLERFFEANTQKPPALLLLILKWDMTNVESLRKVLLYFWNEILEQPEVVPVAPEKLPGECKETNHHCHDKESRLTHVLSNISKRNASEGTLLGTIAAHNRQFDLDDATFMRLIARLHYHARMVWPASLPTISAMLGQYLKIVLINSFENADKLSGKTHRRFCRLYNRFIHHLALPSSVEPYKSVVHHRNAQRILFELEGEFDPPLLLDERSYHTTAILFAASKKTGRESKAATLRSREWPPYRVDQDGIDAQRDLEKDKSRVLLALSHKQASGYRNRHSVDAILQILGGQELDSTPTIHTRRWIVLRPVKPQKTCYPAIDSRVWEARIVATRDVQEAWSAFERFREQGGRPSQSMYYQMFEKLFFDMVRTKRKPSAHTPPGSGREVLPVADNNFSTSYRAYLQPPSLEALYDQMMASGVRPSGKILTFLVEHASSVHQGMRFLRDSKALSKSSFFWLTGKFNHSVKRPQVPTKIFAAFLSLICRLAPRVIEEKETHKELELRMVPLELNRSLKTRRILGLRNTGIHQPLLHAVYLLKLQKTLYRPAWYSLFKALSRPGVVIVRRLAGTQKDNLLSWRVLEAALSDFNNLGLQLDPEGFRILCCGFCRASLALKSEYGVRFKASKATVTLKSEFLKMSTASEPAHNLPRVSYTIRPSVLHTYVRAMGMSDDFDGMIHLLEWMLQETRKSEEGMRLVFVAMVHFMEVVPDTWPLLEKGAALWGGWPAADELEEYVKKGQEYDRNSLQTDL